MCEPYVLNKIETAVAEKLTAGEMFTAFDITLMLQQRGIKQYHRELRSDIKRVAANMMTRYLYRSTLVVLPGINKQAVLYHPFGADINYYQPSFRNGVSYC